MSISEATIKSMNLLDEIENKDLDLAFRGKVNCDSKV
jgi:hypothetical protein